jgi:nickel/cobalt transporter (NicO) family protein
MTQLLNFAFTAMLALGLLVAAPADSFAQGAPQAGQEQSRAAWPARAGAQPDAAADQSLSWQSWLLDLQRRLQTDLAGAVRALKTGENSWLAALTLIGLSFLYGVLHAAGPGHGKAVISSYVVANRQTVRRGVILSFAASLVQALSAIGMVTVLAIGLNAAGLQIKAAVHQFEIASSMLVMLAGLFLLALQMQRHLPVWRPAGAVAEGIPIPVPDADERSHHRDAHCGSCGHGHAHMPGAEDLAGPWSLRHAAAIVLAVGIRPCTGAILVLIFALTQGMFWAGVLATFAMALGTAITVSALAVLAVGSRDLAVRLVGGRWADRIHGAAGIGGALLVVGFGAILLYGALYHPSPF